MRQFHRIAAAALATALSILVAAPGSTEESPYVITSRQIPPEYKTTVEFLEYLKPARESPKGGFDPVIAPKWDLARLMSFIADDGLIVSDVNRGGKAQKLSGKQIRNAVTARKGQVFVTLTHLGYIYAQPYKHYSELGFDPQAGGGVVVRVADWYRLAFAQQGGQLKLTRLDYLMREGG